MSPLVYLIMWLGVSFYAGYVIGNCRGYWEAWNRGMDIANRYRALLHRVTGLEDLGPTDDKHKDLPS